MVLCSSSILLMLEKAIRPCFVPLWCVVFGMVCFLVGCEVRLFFVGSVVLLTMMVIFFGTALFLRSLRFENSEFHDLVRLVKADWPRCLLWHGWLPMISGVNGAPPWAVDATESAIDLLEVALGRYSSEFISAWVPSDDFDHDMAASSLSDHPDVWTDGRVLLVFLLLVLVFCSPGCVCLETS